VILWHACVRRPAAGPGSAAQRGRCKPSSAPSTWPARTSECAGRIAPAGFGALLCAARIARYLAAIVAEQGGWTRAQIEEYLNRWLADYVMTEDDARGIVRVVRPLRAASVALRDAADGFVASLSVVPGYQADPAQPPIVLNVPLKPWRAQP
jgi:predicted component of type VI protein secretion system